MVARIIVGIDGSGPSSAGLRWSLKRARADGCSLVLVHIIDDEARETDQGEQSLADALEVARAAGRDVHVEVARGHPVTGLAEQSHSGDLLVVGSHKTGFVRGRVLGSRGILVASLARSSVVVVPEDNLAQRAGVVVGVAAGSECHAAIIAGASEAQRLGQELSLIHSGPDLPEAVEAGRALLATAAELAATTAPGIVIRRRLSHRGPTDTLLDASRGSALLVLGAARDRGERGGMLGSVTHEVLLNLTSPVMVAR